MERRTHPWGAGSEIMLTWRDQVHAYHALNDQKRKEFWSNTVLQAQSASHIVHH